MSTQYNSKARKKRVCSEQKLQMEIQVGTIGESWRSARTWGGRQYPNPTEHLQMVQNEIWLSPSLSLRHSGKLWGRLLFEGVQKLPFCVGENSKEIWTQPWLQVHMVHRVICETGWLGRRLNTSFQLMISCKVTGKNRNKIFSFTSQGSRAIPTELSLNSNGHTHAGACLSWRLIAAIYSKWACAQCVFAGPDKNESLATDLETD